MKITIDNISFAYPAKVQALQNISLMIEPGELLAILGQNGSGKTTLVKHLNGLLRPTDGQIQIGDWLTRDHSVAQMAARVGYVFQNPDQQLFKSTVLEEVRFGPQNLGYPPAKLEALVQAALDMLELNEHTETNPYDLTPTWRKRVATAAIIAMDTPIIVLDEPTTGQDHRHLLHLAHVIKTLHGQGKTIIAVSHDIDFVAENFQRIIVMGQGRILLDGPPETVFAETETLRSTYVAPPQLTRLGQRLALGQTVYTGSGFLKRFRAKLNDGST